MLYVVMEEKYKTDPDNALVIDHSKTLPYARLLADMHANGCVVVCLKCGAIVEGIEDHSCAVVPS